MARYFELCALGDSNYTAFDVSVAIMSLTETLTVLDGEAAGRSKIRGRMIRDPIGGYIGHKITCRRLGTNTQGLDDLWTWLTLHCCEDSVYLRAADGQSVIAYECYYTTAERKLEYAHNGVNYWGEITINFIPMEPQITP